MIININKNDEYSIKYASKEAAKIINAGGIVISPTDTVYGMLANAFNMEAINKIYSIKEREKEKPLVVLLKDINQAENFSNKKVPNFIKNNVPGELTFIMPLLDELKKKFLYLKDTIALRIPNDNYMQLILEKTNHIVAPSANPSGYGIILDGNKLVNIYKDKVDLIVNAGILDNKVPSTLYDCINNKIIRQGNVYLDM